MHFCIKGIFLARNTQYLPKSASILCRATECNTLQLCRAAKVARHMPPMRSCPHEKIIFCRPSLGYQNCGTRSVNLVWFFSQTGWYHFETPYLLYAVRLLLMGPTDNLPIEFLGHAASNGMPQPSQRNVHIYLWYGATFATQPCRTLPLYAARHSVDVP